MADLGAWTIDGVMTDTDVSGQVNFVGKATSAAGADTIDGTAFKIPAGKYKEASLHGFSNAAGEAETVTMKLMARVYDGSNDNYMTVATAATGTGALSTSTFSLNINNYPQGWFKFQISSSGVLDADKTMNVILCLQEAPANRA